MLDVLYDGAAWLAAACMIGILAMVLTSILGRALNFHLPGTDAYAGYAMAAAGFLALAHTLKRNEHIRVTLFIGRMQGGLRHLVELWSLLIALALAGFITVFAVRLCWDSYAFNDISTASDATPMWIPQLAMATGAAVFFIALMDECFLELMGHRVRQQAEEAHYE